MGAAGVRGRLLWSARQSWQTRAVAGVGVTLGLVVLGMGVWSLVEGPVETGLALLVVGLFGYPIAVAAGFAPRLGVYCPASRFLAGPAACGW